MDPTQPSPEPPNPTAISCKPMLSLLLHLLLLLTSIPASQCSTCSSSIPTSTSSMCSTQQDSFTLFSESRRYRVLEGQVSQDLYYLYKLIASKPIPPISPWFWFAPNLNFLGEQILIWIEPRIYGIDKFDGRVWKSDRSLCWCS